MTKRRSHRSEPTNSRRDYQRKDYRVQEPEPQTTKGKIQTTVLIKPVNESQRKMVQSIRNNTITVVSGQAGTGKSMCALYEAVRYINSQESPITKIFYIRSNVDMQEDRGIGFLAGSLVDKILPLAFPVLDNLIEFMEEGKAQFLVEKEIVRVLPVSFIRGRSLANSFVIIDEAQNLSPHMIKALLTRVSHGSKMVFLGDTGQIDIETAKSGYQRVINRLEGCPDVGVITFNKNEVVRHPIIQNILERLEGLS